MRIEPRMAHNDNLTRTLISDRHGLCYCTTLQTQGRSLTIGEFTKTGGENKSRGRQLSTSGKKLGCPRELRIHVRWFNV
jgi:hypothetical protein